MEKMREEFESWFQKKINSLPLKLSLVRYDGGLYVCDFAQLAWMSWCDSRCSLVVELPSFESGSLRGYNGDCEEARMVVDAIAESLEKAGVSYE